MDRSTGTGHLVVNVICIKACVFGFFWLFAWKRLAPLDEYTAKQTRARDSSTKPSKKDTFVSRPMSTKRFFEDVPAMR